PPERFPASSWSLLAPPAVFWMRSAAAAGDPSSPQASSVPAHRRASLSVLLTLPSLAWPAASYRPLRQLCSPAHGSRADIFSILQPESAVWPRAHCPPRSPQVGSSSACRATP